MRNHSWTVVKGVSGQPCIKTDPWGRLGLSCLCEGHGFVREEKFDGKAEKIGNRQKSALPSGFSGGRDGGIMRAYKYGSVELMRNTSLM